MQIQQTRERRVGDEKNEENRRSAIFQLLNDPPRMWKTKSHCVIIRRSLEDNNQHECKDFVAQRKRGLLTAVVVIKKRR